MPNIQNVFEAGLLPDAPIKYAFDNHSLHMALEGSPTSIRENEFEFLNRFIIAHKLKNGFELGTGFGVSTVAIGLGFKHTGGHLISMDAYTEEKFGYYVYDACSNDVFKDAIGYKSAQFLVKTFQLEDVVSIIQGWSPTDVPSVLEKSQPLDFVFIDAMHCDESVINDLNAVFPFMSKKSVLFLHDVHCFSQKVKDCVKMLFGKTYGTIPTCNLDYGLGYNLSIMSRL
jgi:predicted O-methyltransferase YrrM